MKRESEADNKHLYLNRIRTSQFHALGISANFCGPFNLRFVSVINYKQFPYFNLLNTAAILKMTKYVSQVELPSDDSNCVIVWLKVTVEEVDSDWEFFFSPIHFSHRFNIKYKFCMEESLQSKTNIKGFPLSLQLNVIKNVLGHITVHSLKAS